MEVVGGLFSDMLSKMPACCHENKPGAGQLHAGVGVQRAWDIHAERERMKQEEYIYI